ncbi:MAG: AAA family ATPase [Candidatus Polarisedimenticolia bacterium]
MTAVERVVDALRASGGNPRPNGAGHVARCPSHDDRHASLSIGDGDDGRALLNCHAGCSVEQIVGALGITTADLFERSNGHSGQPRILRTYPYHDEAGSVLFECVRFEPKDFRQRRPDGAGGWIWNLKDTRRVLYNFPAVIATVADGGTVFVDEGEKDCDAINAVDGNHVATCNPMGAGKWRPEYSEMLRGANVIIVADADEPGRKHAREVQAALLGYAKSVRVVEAASGKDAHDHLAAGHSLDDFIPWPAPAGEQPEPEVRDLAEPMDLAGAVTTPAESIDWLIHPWAARGDLVIMASEVGVGKSWAGMDLAVAAARGGRFLGLLDIKGPLRVLYMDLENGPRLARWRFQRLARGLEMTPEEAAGLQLHYLCQDSLNLSAPAGRSMLARKVDTFHPELIVFDTLKRLHRADENSNTEMSGFFADAIRPLLMHHGATVVCLHHLGKPGANRDEGDILNRLRGASDIAGVADQVWGLQRAGETAFSLSHIKARWARPALDLAVSIEDTMDHRGTILVAKERGGLVAGIIDQMLAAGELAGVLRADIVKRVAETIGGAPAPKAVTRELGRMYDRGQVRKKGNKAGMRYWTTSYAPGDAE